MTIAVILVASVDSQLEQEIAEAGAEYAHLAGLPKALLPITGGKRVLDYWWGAIEGQRRISDVYIARRPSRSDGSRRRRRRGEAAARAEDWLKKRRVETKTVFAALACWRRPLEGQDRRVRSRPQVTNAKAFKHFERWSTSRGIPARNVVNDGTTTRGTSLGAARDLRLALSRVDYFEGGSDRDVVVIAGDSLFHREFDLAALVSDQHVRSGNSLAVSRVRRADHFSDASRRRRGRGVESPRRRGAVAPRLRGECGDAAP